MFKIWSLLKGGLVLKLCQIREGAVYYWNCVRVNLRNYDNKIKLKTDGYFLGDIELK